MAILSKESSSEHFIFVPRFSGDLLIGLDTLCKHNFGHYAIVGASSIIPA